MTLTNSVLWGNTVLDPNDPNQGGTQLSLNGGVGAVITLSHCCLQDRLTTGAVAFSSGTLTWSAGNIGEDSGDNPQFIQTPAAGTDGIWGTSDDTGDLKLAVSSPCVNAGSDSLVPADDADIDGDPSTTVTPFDHAEASRFIACSVDMGAFENQSDNTCPGEATCDGNVDVADLLAVIGAWGSCGDPQLTCPADIAPAILDNVVDVQDLLKVIGEWGRVCDTGQYSDVGDINSISDCMDAATSMELEPYSPEWNDAVQKCVNALCAAEIIDCD